jgi:hypothetical protein
MLAFVSGFLVVAGTWGEQPVWLRRTSLVLLAIPAAVGFLLLSYLALPSGAVLRLGGQPLSFPRMEEFVGRRQFAELVARNAAVEGVDFVCFTRHQNMGTVAYYVPELRGRLTVTDFDRDRFPWQDKQQWAGRDALLVTKSKRAGPAVRALFDELQLLGEYPILAKTAVRGRFYLYRATGYRPDAPPVGSADEALHPAVGPEPAPAG